MKSSIDRTNAVEKGVLTLCANALFDRKISLPADTDITAVWRECLMQGVGSLAFSSYKTDDCGETFGLIKKALKNRLIVNMSVNSSHAFLHRLMTENAVEYVILKGCVSASFYPDPMLRDMGDVDFLVPPEYQEKASDILLSHGFVRSHENHGFHTVFEKDGMRFELHREPSGIPDSSAGQRVREFFSDIFERSSVIETSFGPLCAPSAFHHGLILLVHSAHHLTGEGLGLRHICDWAAFENSFDESEFVSLFKEKLESVGLWNFACVLTKICADYLGADERGFCADADEQLCREILSDVFSGGNFGQKNSDRAHEALIMQKPGGEKKRSKLSQLIYTANRIVYQKWRAAERLKFLLPIGWLFFGGRYILRSLFGKRPKINVLSVSRGADERTAVYSRLKLYKKE